MKINCGIIGLPNVGKSTLFNLLTDISVKIENFCFSTIQPNIAIIQIPDDRLNQINNIIKSKSIKKGIIEFIDIAGLIKGAAQGEGLGYETLHHIKNTKILCHVIRCFDNNSIVHIENNIDPKRDIHIINTELVLFDILQCEKHINSLKKSRVSHSELDKTLFLLETCLDKLYHGIMLRNIQFSQIEIKNIQKFNFLTFKPVIYIANVSQTYHNNNVYFKELKKIGYDFDIPIISYCGINNIQYLSQKKDNNFILLNMIINNIMSLLKLSTFFTVNLNMIKAWIFPIDMIAIDAAHTVHSDFQKGFIRVQVIKCTDFITNKGEVGLKKLGKIFFAGKSYKIQDGDILKFLFTNKS